MSQIWLTSDLPKMKESKYEGIARDLQEKVGSFSISEILQFLVDKNNSVDSNRREHFEAIKNWIANMQVSSYLDEKKIRRYTII